MTKKNENTVKTISVWRRIHRPEDYAADAAKFVASELKLPRFLAAPFVPIACKALKKWEDAAVETTALYEFECGKRMMRTFFEITDYSNEAFYGMAEKVLKKLGVGSSMAGKYGDTDFAWVMLGGVLDEYASKAGIQRETAKLLIDFRMPLSDYFTATSWYPDHVEIANLRTGRVETLEIPARDIEKIVKWSVNFENKLTGSKALKLAPGSCEHDEYLKLEELYLQKTTC